MNTINNTPRKNISSICDYMEVKDILNLSECNKSLHRKIFNDQKIQGLFEKRLGLDLKTVALSSSLAQLKDGRYSRFLYEIFKYKMAFNLSINLMIKFGNEKKNIDNKSIKLSDDSVLKIIKNITGKLAGKEKLHKLLNAKEINAIEQIKKIAFLAKPIQSYINDQTPSFLYLAHEDWQELLKIYKDCPSLLNFPVWGLSYERPLDLIETKLRALEKSPCLEGLERCAEYQETMSLETLKESLKAMKKIDRIVIERNFLRKAIENLRNLEENFVQNILSINKIKQD